MFIDELKSANKQLQEEKKILEQEIMELQSTIDEN
jgi:hypothetical protein